MVQGSILFVHGTGVRLAGYRDTFELAKTNAAKAGIGSAFVECAWGDPLGIEFEGLSLPDPIDEGQLQRQSEDFNRWSWLFADPMCELEKLTIRDSSVLQKKPIRGVMPSWLLKWNEVQAYNPSTELRLLLDRAGIDDSAWRRAWRRVVGPGSIAKDAFQSSSHELPEAVQALARAVVAQLHHNLMAQEAAAPSRTLRERMVERLVADWHGAVLAPGGFFVNMIKRLATDHLKQHRSSLTDLVAPFVGDILLYQTHGDTIRRFIRQKIEETDGPVTIVAHSLGGIASFDLLAMPDAPRVHRLVTVGSQSPLLYEIGAIASLKRGQSLPDKFPPWLNIYDRNDMLSYVAGRLLGPVKDVEVESGQPFPAAHSAYFGNEEVWAEIHRFL
jgi:hypothetical protein